MGINFWDTAPFYGAGSAERVTPLCDLLQFSGLVNVTM